MPLKLLKRTSKQYNVVSKSTFVISVELLDNGIMECTLDADSTGRDCLLNISQRLGLHQPEFFGLRYISRGVPPRQRWVELNRPLKKQLEKHAQDSQLSLGVMFYVADVNLLKDEMARYHYFLQLKSDVIDGKLNCSIDQAISLAAYSLQAEFGDYDPERHTIEYLRDFAILPKELTSEQKYADVNVNALYETVARQYGSLIGFPPPLAEIYYIMVAQQLDGYGQEAYPAKDDSGNDILICVSVNGLVIRRRDWTHIAAFRWSDIKSLIGHKRLFVVESAQSQRTMQFHFTDPEVAKYVRKMCLLQSTFYKESILAESNNEHLRTNNYSVSNSDQTDGASQTGISLRTTPDLIAPSLGRSVAGSQYSLNNNGFTPNNTNLNSSGFNLHLLHQQSTQAQMQQHAAGLNQQRHPFHQSLQDISPLTPMMSTMQMPDLAGNVSLAHHNLNLNLNLTHNPEGNNMDIHTMQSLLPSYRPAPAYDTAVQLKYGHGVTVKGSPQLYFDNQANLVNEDEPIYQNEIVSQMHSIELRDSLPQSHSSPDMSVQQAGIQQEDPHMYIYKPPPPYPGSALAQEQQNNKVEQSSPKAGTSASFNPTNNSSLLQNKESGSPRHARSTSVVSAEVHTQPQPSKSHERPQNTSSTSIASSNLNTSSTSSLSKISSIGSNSSIVKKEDIIKEKLSSSEIKEKDKYKAGHLFGKPIDPNILREFQAIPRGKPNPSFITALKRENSKRNRYPDVLPYEDNAIRLSPSRSNPSGYINASPVSAHVSGRDWKYLVGQIPLTGNAPAVWQMIWETEAKIIAVLERDSSALFYPLENGSCLTFNDFQIYESKGERSTAASIARELTLVYTPKKKQRKVWILPYEEEWKDDVPIHTEHFLCFLEEVNSIQRKVSDAMTPLTVLCGTGAGRSGVLILSDLLLHAADSGHKLRCDSLLGELRTQRMLLVSSAPQYAFVLHTLAKYLAQSRLI